jgi:hypothetical protein
MLLVITAVVFAAGCSSNTETTSNVSAGASEHETPKTSVADEGASHSEAAGSIPADANVTESNETEVNQTGNETNVSAAATGAPQGSKGRVSLTAMKLEKIRAARGLNNTTS